MVPQALLQLLRQVGATPRAGAGALRLVARQGLAHRLTHFVHQITSPQLFLCLWSPETPPFRAKHEGKRPENRWKTPHEGLNSSFSSYFQLLMFSRSSCGRNCLVRRSVTGFDSTALRFKASTSSRRPCKDHGPTILYFTLLYYTILYYTILYYTILYYTLLYYTILYYTILNYAILYIIYYTILYYTVRYDTIRYHTIQVQRPSMYHDLVGGGDQQHRTIYICIHSNIYIYHVYK